MPDIALALPQGHARAVRSPRRRSLPGRAFDAARDLEFVNLVEPEAVRDALRLELHGRRPVPRCEHGGHRACPPGASRHGRPRGGRSSARAALASCRRLSPSTCWRRWSRAACRSTRASKASLNENRSQYARAARAFDGRGVRRVLPERVREPAPTSSARSWACARRPICPCSRPWTWTATALADGRRTLRRRWRSWWSTGPPWPASPRRARRSGRGVRRRACAATGLPVLVQLAWASMLRSRAAPRREPLLLPRRHGGGCGTPACGRRPVPARRGRHAGLHWRARGGH